MTNNIDKIINCFKLIDSNIIIPMIECEEWVCKIKAICPGIKTEQINDLIKWTEKKYSESPFNINIKTALEELYENLSRGLSIDDSIIKTKGFIKGEIQIKYYEEKIHDNFL
jgi:hypothetical protein